MKYFFDNSISPNIVRMLQIVRVDAIHLQDEFPADTTDEDWLRGLRDKDYIVLCADKRILRNEKERIALQYSGKTVLFLYKQFPKQDIWTQVSWVFGHWQQLSRNAERLNVGTLVDVQQNGSMQVIPMRG